MKIFIKSPDANLDYAIDWSEELGSDVIIDSQWLVPEGLTLGASSHTNTVAVVWLSGGQLGKMYRVTNRITTQGGRVDDRSFLLRIEHQ